MNQQLISIVLCTYNGEKFLQEQVESLLSQTYKNMEIIVSDDCSTDNTRNVLERYRNDPRFTIVLQERNLGPIKNFEHATSLAKGEFISFSDQDDIWLPEKLEKLHAAIGDKWLVYSDSELVNEEGQRLGKKLSDLRNMYSGNDTRGFVFSNVVWGHAMLINNDLLKHVLPIPSGVPHDIWMAFKAAALTGIHYVNEPLTLYRQHEHTVTKTVGAKTTSRPLSKRYKDFLEKLNWMEIMRSDERFFAFYDRLASMFALKEQGKFVWKLFFFLLKYRSVLFQFTKKSILSQVLEIRKLARGEQK